MVFCCGGGITKPFCKIYKIRHIQMCTNKNDPHIWASLRGLAGSRAANIRILIDNIYFSAWKITQKWISLKFLYLIMLNRAIKPCSFYKARKNMRKMLPLHCPYPYRKPRWAEVGQTYIHIRRNCTLWFWRSKNLTVRAKLSRTKQRERLMRCIVYSPHWLRTILSFVVKSAFYIRTQAWGFRRCSFRTNRAMRRP